jgi:hypothetical protein
VAEVVKVLLLIFVIAGWLLFCRYGTKPVDPEPEMGRKVAFLKDPGPVTDRTDDIYCFDGEGWRKSEGRKSMDDWCMHVGDAFLKDLGPLTQCCEMVGCQNCEGK